MALAALYVYAIPVTALDSKEKIVTSVSVVFFGSAIGHIIGLLVGVSVLGCLAATVLVGPRVIFAMSRDGMLPKFASDIHPDYFTPGNAIVLQAIMTSILVFSGTFDTLLDYITVPSVFFSGLNGVGLFVLRMRQRSEENAQVYKTFGYPLVPGLFVVGMMWIVINTVLKNPTNSIWGLAMVCIGIPIYYLIKVVHLSYSVADSKDLLTIPPELCRGGKPCELLPSALAALEDMVAEAKKTNIDIVVISAHRTRDFQKELFEDAQQRHGKSHAIRWVAPPGRSEHHTGYVVDLADLNCPEYDDEPGFENTPAGLWLLENGPRFGFKLSFPKNNWQKIGYEPWHWRFEGTLDAYAQFHHGIWNKITHIVFS